MWYQQLVGEASMSPLGHSDTPPPFVQGHSGPSERRGRVEPADIHGGGQQGLRSQGFAHRHQLARAHHVVSIKKDGDIS